MLGKLVSIKIKRETNEIVDGKYVKIDIYNITGNVIEIKNSHFSTDVSQAEVVQQYAFGIGVKNTDVKIGDLVYHNDCLGDIISKISERPKFIEFEGGECFIKLRTKFIGN